MSEFIFTYHGGKKPSSPEEGAELMKKWKAWEEDLGSALIKPGSPVGKTKLIGSTGLLDQESSNPISGFSILKAENMEQAIQLLKTCPHMELDGTLEVSEIMKM